MSDDGRFTSSVVSYPNRGSYGQSSYRGNTTGRIIVQFLETFHVSPRGLFVDPMEGGGTSKDVAKELGIEYRGFDLKKGFNILKDDLRSKLPRAAHSAFIHPPYMNMIDYGGGEGDMSKVSDIGEFLEICQLGLLNLYQALEPGGHYAVLMGNMRKAGKFYPIASRLAMFSPGEQVVEIIKIQNNMTSNSRMGFYKGTFVPTTHEMLTVFKKPESMLYYLDVAITKEKVSMRLSEGTWRNVVRMSMMGKGKMTLNQIYNEVAQSGKKLNDNWKAKIRQVVQSFPEFEHVDRGVYQTQFQSV